MGCINFYILVTQNCAIDNYQKFDLIHEVSVATPIE